MFITIEKTKEELAKDAVNAFSGESSQVLENYKQNYHRLFNMIWSTSVHPQDFFNALGNKAVIIFQTAQEVVMHIMKLDPSYTPPTAPYKFTIGRDGTVTVGEKIEEESVL